MLEGILKRLHEMTLKTVIEKLLLTLHMKHDFSTGIVHLQDRAAWFPLILDLFVLDG